MDLYTLLRRGRRIRTLGIDDGPFVRGRRSDVLVVGAVYCAAQFEGLLTTRVRQDGGNATARLARMIGGSKFHSQLHVVMLDGITLGGFNVVDLPLLATSIGLPCLAVMRRHPDHQAVNHALARLRNPDQRRLIMDRAGLIHRAGAVCFQTAGIAPEVARAVIQRSVVIGCVPECLRAAHLIASGVVRGESGHRA